MWQFVRGHLSYCARATQLCEYTSTMLVVRQQLDAFKVFQLCLLIMILDILWLIAESVQVCCENQYVTILWLIAIDKWEHCLKNYFLIIQRVELSASKSWLMTFQLQHWTLQPHKFDLMTTRQWTNWPKDKSPQDISMIFLGWYLKSLHFLWNTLKFWMNKFILQLLIITCIFIHPTLNLFYIFYPYIFRLFSSTKPF